MTMTPAPQLPTLRHTLICATLLLATALPGRAVDLLAGKPLVLTGTHGRFDFLAIDVEGRRLLAAHTGNGSLDIIDIDRSEEHTSELQSPC